MAEVAILHLTGPLQSWAGFSVVKTRVDTQKKPGDRAILGLVAGSFGVHRGSDLPDLLQSMEISVYPRRGGRTVRDYQTISIQEADRIGARPQDQLFYNRMGRIFSRGKVTPDKLVVNSAQVIERTYLADASFLVFLKGKTDEETRAIQLQLENPVWSPYLGRKAFPPSFPFLLGLHQEETAQVRALALIDSIEEKLDEYSR